MVGRDGVSNRLNFTTTNMTDTDGGGRRSSRKGEHFCLFAKKVAFDVCVLCVHVRACVCARADAPYECICVSTLSEEA